MKNFVLTNKNILNVNDIVRVRRTPDDTELYLNKRIYPETPKISFDTDLWKHFQEHLNKYKLPEFITIFDNTINMNNIVRVEERIGDTYIYFEKDATDSNGLSMSKRAWEIFKEHIAKN